MALLDGEPTQAELNERSKAILTKLAGEVASNPCSGPMGRKLIDLAQVAGATDGEVKQAIRNALPKVLILQQ